MACDNELHSDSILDPSLDDLYDALNDLMIEYKKLKRNNKDLNSLCQNLSEKLNSITKEKDFLSKENHVVHQYLLVAKKSLVLLVCRWSSYVDTSSESCCTLAHESIALHSAVLAFLCSPPHSIGCKSD